MADSTQGKKTPAKRPAKSRQAPKSRTVELAQKLALAVIREYGLPEEIREELLDAGVSSIVIDKIGGAYDDHPHGAYGYKRKKK